MMFLSILIISAIQAQNEVRYLHLLGLLAFVLMWFYEIPFACLTRGNMKMSSQFLAYCLISDSLWWAGSLRSLTILILNA